MTFEVEIKYQNKKEQTKLVVEFDKIDLSPKTVVLNAPKNLNAPKKKKVKYIQIPVSLTCRKQLNKRRQMGLLKK